MKPAFPYKIVSDAIPPLLAYLQDQKIKRCFLVADPKTYQILGQRAESALHAEGIDVKTILLTGKEISTDEHFITQTLMETNGEDRPFIAVGSGTVTDITRFVSHRSREIFISLPTAPSVDGYASIVAPTVIGVYKYPIPAQPPAAIFADLPTLCGAPRPMIAAGLGDLLGKYTSLVDWRIGALLYDEPYNEEIAHQMREAVDQTVEVIDSIASSACEGITRLMNGLVNSGFGMLAFGESRPASGSEHHLGHFWEMKFILENRPAQLHGAEVAVSTILAARRYQWLRQITRSEAERMLASRPLPDQDKMLAEIREGYGPVTPLIVQIQKPLFAMTPEDHSRLKSRIIQNWDEIQRLAQTVPSPEQFAQWLSALNGPTHPHDISLESNETLLGLKCAHYLRDRFTINRLGFWLGFPSDI